MTRSMEKKRSLDDIAENSKTCELTEIVDPVHCRVVTLPDSSDPTNKVFPTLFFSWKGFCSYLVHFIEAKVLYIYRLFVFFTPILGLAFWLLVRKGFRSFGNGAEMNRIPLERWFCALLYYTILFPTYPDICLAYDTVCMSAHMYSFKYFWFIFLWVLKATTSVVPQHWQPNNGLLMTNDVPDNSEEAVPCIALSKNDSYVMSACGGKISLFNMMTFKVTWQL